MRNGSASTTTYAVTGQTYPRKVDAQIVDLLSQIGASAHKGATDLRILASRKEIEEPFEKSQIGSSAMAYKRNPMRSERICSLARYAMASRRRQPRRTRRSGWSGRSTTAPPAELILPQGFLTIDAVLVLYQNVAEGLVVYPNVIARHLASELPFMVTENILMRAVAAGGDRQELHERIRQHSQAAANVVKQEGRDNDLLDRLAGDPAFARVDLTEVTDASKLIGRAPQQVDEFLTNIVAPIRRRYGDDFGEAVEVRV